MPGVLSPGVENDPHVRRILGRRAFARCDRDRLIELAEQAVHTRLFYPKGRKDKNWYWRLSKRRVRRLPQRLRRIAADIESMNMAALGGEALFGVHTREDRKSPPLDFPIKVASWSGRYEIPFNAVCQLLPAGLKRYADRMEILAKRGESLSPVEEGIGQFEAALVAYVEQAEGKPRFEAVAEFLAAVMRIHARLTGARPQLKCYDLDAFKSRHYRRKVAKLPL